MEGSRLQTLTKLRSYFAHFEGHQDCGVTSKDLYIPPVPLDDNHPKHKLYCSDRAALLEAMSGGGRHGFERPYFPIGCHYRWYSTPEICMILERFDAVVFIGDDTLKTIYAAFNMLLRENIAMGGLKQWELTEKDRTTCRCDNQLMRPECSIHAITESQVVAENDESSGHKSPYYCGRKQSCARSIGEPLNWQMQARHICFSPSQTPQLPRIFTPDSPLCSATTLTPTSQSQSSTPLD